MTARWRRRLGLFLDGLLGPRCAATRDRVWPADRRRHEETQHPTDGPCDG